MTAVIIHIDDMPTTPNAVYIGRAMPRRTLARSPLANPYKITTSTPRALAVAMYAAWLYSRIGSGDAEVIDALIACRDRPLACWCRHAGEPWSPETHCHGDQIVAVLNSFTDDDLRAKKVQP